MEQQLAEQRSQHERYVHQLAVRHDAIIAQLRQEQSQAAKQEAAANAEALEEVCACTFGLLVKGRWVVRRLQ